MNNKLKIDFHILFPFLLTLILWIVFYYQETTSKNSFSLGLIPRKKEGLLGILTHFFIHENFKHILSNTLSFLVLSVLLFYGYRENAFKLFFFMFFSTGIILWLIGRNSENGKTIQHIGCSGVIFALFGFLVVSGIIRKNKPQMAISALVIFLYGYFVWGIFPIEKKVSWDGHLSGLISGIIFAFLNKHQNIAIEKYEFSESEEEKLDNLPESEKYWLNSKDENFEEEEKPKKTSTDPFVININYEYKLKENIKKDSDNE